MNQLEVLRESLGQCDEIILDALLMRNRIVEDIMVYKEANNVPILQPEQEANQKIRLAVTEVLFAVGLENIGDAHTGTLCDDLSAVRNTRPQPTSSSRRTERVSWRFVRS